MAQIVQEHVIRSVLHSSTIQLENLQVVVKLVKNYI